MQSSIARGRFVELDSLRGLAALTVVFHHFLLAAPAIYFAILPVYDPSVRRTSTALNFIVFSPLHGFWSGTEAVVFFFLLSGFVLSLPFFDCSVGYPAFVIKRICRVYLPYLSAVGVAIGLASVFSRGGIAGLSPWFNTIWTTPLSPGLLLGHLGLIGNFRNGVFDPVLWSLVYEMRISLIFPFLMYAVVRLSWRWTLGGAVALSIAGPFLSSSDWVRTLEYIPMFIIGALLAKHRVALASTVAGLSQRRLVFVTCVAILTYTYVWWLLPFSPVLHPNIGLTHARIVDEWTTTIGASIFVMLAIGSARASRALRHKGLVLIGRISYSVYLFHAIMLFTIIYLLYPRLPILLIWPMALGATLAISLVSYRYVEVPGIQLGRLLTERILPKREAFPETLPRAA
jgi:peptidoglycan/LPS O-acetylase OafA/YrhL